nr:hypothetical protein [Scytonema sp. UIC 10036]
MKEWVLQAETELGNEAGKLGSSYDLTIEFFLPYEYLATTVEQWKVREGSSRWQKLKEIGKKHRVVVRSLDRLEDSDLLNRLVKTWQEAEIFLQKNPSEEDIQAKIENLDCLVGCNWDNLTRRLESLQKMTLKLPCVMSGCEASSKPTHLSRLFESGLLGGTPIIFWSRRCNLSGSNVFSEMDRLLKAEMLSNLDLFLEEVMKIRKAAPDAQHLGSNLAILCDEPKRLRQIKKLLKENKFWGMSV